MEIIKITGIVETVPELKFMCYNCNTDFWIGEILFNNTMGIVSPCKCYQCNNEEADNTMEIHNTSLEEDESFEFEDIA